MKKNLVWIIGVVVVLAIVVLAVFVWPIPQFVEYVKVQQSKEVLEKLVYTGPLPVPTATIQVSLSTPTVKSLQEVAVKEAVAAQVVVTATGVSDLGTLLDIQQMTPVVSGEITWDNIKKIADWREDVGLTGVQVLYAQSGVPNQIDLPMLKGKTSFIVPQGTVLIFGALSANLTLGNGKNFAYGNGFYEAISENTEVKALTVNNGFLLLVKDSDAKAEYCARIAQAANQKWAMEHRYRPEAWQDSVCIGTITTVIDPDN